MQIAPVTPAAPAISARVPETQEKPGPDRDGDTDDKASVATSAAVAAPPPGMGKSVSTSA